MTRSQVGVSNKWREAYNILILLNKLNINVSMSCMRMVFIIAEMNEKEAYITS